MALERILVATDLEPKSDAAIRYALFLADRLGSEVVATHVVQSRDLHLEEGVHRPDRVGDLATTRAHEQLDAQIARISAGAHDITTDVRFGDPALDVIASAAEHECSLIVVIVESRSRLGKLLMGSHAQQILLDSSIPVVGVKPDWQPPQ